MHQFPEDYELIGFFEVEPEVLDKDIPWAYNELTFISNSTNGTLIVKMVSGSEIMHIEWKQDENVVLELELKGVLGLTVGDGKNGYSMNTLVAKFRDSNVKSLFITIRPLITFKWGYNEQQQHT